MGLPRMKLLFFVALLLFNFLLITRGRLLSVENYDSIRDLYYSTHGDNWKWKDESFYGVKWNITGNYQDGCSLNWQGLTCSNQSGLSGIVLVSYGLVGTLPQNIFQNISNITIFNISANNVTGILPQSIKYVSKLTLLDLNFNKFSGELPTCIYGLRNLNNFLIWNNSFSGTLSSLIGNLKKMHKV